MAAKLVLVLALVAAVRAQIPGFGGCPDTPPVTNFQMEKFLGDWYEYERYLTSVFEFGTICSKVKYTKNEADGTYHAANSLTTRLTGVTRVLNGDMKLAEPGKLSIRYDQLPLSVTSVYSVVATDYDNYAVLYSCNVAVPFFLVTQNAWLMTRVKNPDPEILKEAQTQFEKLGISRRLISKVEHNHASCPGETAAPAAAPAPVVAPLRSTVVPAVRNQQVHVKPEANSVEVEEKVEVVKDAEVAPVEPVAPVPAVPVDAPIVDTIKAETEQQTPEPEPEPTPPAEPESTNKPDDAVKAEKVETVAEPVKVVEEKKE